MIIINRLQNFWCALFNMQTQYAFPVPVFWKHHQPKMLLIIGILSLSNLCNAQSNFGIQSIKAVINGTSSLHDWESEITQMEGKGTLLSKGNTITGMTNVEVKILVKGIKSKEGNIMDTKTYEAFLWEKNPYIIYSFKNARVVINEDQTAAVSVSGNLAMAGTTLPLFIIAKGKVLSNGDLELSVSQKIKMTDFGMKPPTAVLGTIKVGNDVTVNLHFILSKSK